MQAKTLSQVPAALRPFFNVYGDSTGQEGVTIRAAGVIFLNNGEGRGVKLLAARPFSGRKTVRAWQCRRRS